MYHPAAALHQASLRETLYRDIRGLPAALLAARRALEEERRAATLANDEWHAAEAAISVSADEVTGAREAAARDAADAEQMTLF